MPFSDHLPPGVRRLLRLPASPARAARELDDEIRFHLDAAAEALRAGGLSEDAARAAALARFGDPSDLRDYCSAISERHARRRGVREWLADWAQDARLALRQFARVPAFTATAVTVLALGIGANTAIFSVVHHLLIAPLPFPDGNRMVNLVSTSGGGRVFVTPNFDLVEAWRTRSRAVDQFTEVWSGDAILGDTAAASVDKVKTVVIAPSAIAFVGSHAVLGRDLAPSDTVYGAPPVALLGHAFWTQHFGASPAVIGQSIRLDGVTHTIVGVMPDGFFVPFESDSRDVYTAMSAGMSKNPSTVIAKLRPGVSVDAANRELATLFPRGSGLNPYDDPPRVLREIDFTAASRRELILMLFGAVGFVLLIACANVANLALARASGRQRELAVRTALGASRWRLARQTLTESVLLALAGGVCGLAVAYGGLHAVVAAQPQGRDLLGGIHMQGAVLAWTLGISIVTGLLFGSVPALLASSARVGEALKGGGRTAAGSLNARRLRGALVVVELALSVVLLTGTGLLVRTLLAVNRADPGFRPAGLIGVEIRRTRQVLADSTARGAAFEAARRALSAIPGVQGAALAVSLPPVFGLAMGSLEIDGRVIDARDTLKVAGFNGVDTGFFRVAGLPITHGGMFTQPVTLGNAAPTELMINEAFARRFWPNGDAVGARIRRSHSMPWATVVGIVGDVRAPGLAEHGEDLQMYEQWQQGFPSATVVLRTTQPEAALDAAIRAAVHDASAGIRLSRIETADELIGHAVDVQRFVLTLLGCFALVAMVIAAVGLHGVVAYSVAQRTREIGVRVALGAESGDVVALVLRHAGLLTAGGVVVGAASALVAARAMRSLLYGVEPRDPITIGAVSVLLGAIAIGAALAPARRAARIDPIEALRTE